MSKSTLRPSSRKAASKHKPGKPYPNFPLFAHASGRWAKKINGTLNYFGPWAKRESGKLVHIPGDGWQAALDNYKAKADDLHAGREPRAPSGDGCTIKQLVNAFLRSKQAKLDAGELARNTFADYHTVCGRLVKHFGHLRRVDGLHPDDFERFRRRLAQTLSVVSLKNAINKSRIIFKFAHDQRLIAQPVHYGQSFEKPSAKMIRKARNEAGPRLFTADEIKQILNSADVYLKAMTLLAINAAMGNTDVAYLPIDAIDFAGGWLTYPRPKTEIQRRIRLWPETLDALKKAIKARPKPKHPEDDDLVFITIQGNRWVRQTPHRKNPDTFTTVNTVGAEIQRFA